MISILTPTRGRPKSCAEMVKTSLATADRPDDLTFYIATDEDDETSDELEDLISDYQQVLHFSGVRKGLAEWTNSLALIAIEDGALLLGSFGDDHRPRTQGWDTRVGDTFVSVGSGLIYTADGLQNERLPTAPFWSADVIEALGWFCPPGFEHMYMDDYWKLLGRDLGRCTYLPHVMIEHMHPAAGKSEMDQVYRDNDKTIRSDQLKFHDIVYTGEHRAAVERVRAALGI